LHKIEIKTPAEIRIMTQGGRKLGRIKKKLVDRVGPGVSAAEIEDLATELIKQEGGTSSFKMVPGYFWSTCINLNKGVVHGIPKKEIVFKNGDLVSIDVGLYYKGFHTDTSVSVLVGQDEKKQQFLAAGQEALSEAVKKAVVGGFLEDISRATESVLRKHGLNPVKALVGHGVGRQLHQAPAVPCFVGPNFPKLELPEGLVLAIEVMYSAGKAEIETDPEDGWTIRTKDGKIAGLFEETVAITRDGPSILTVPN
jgi:methionyl aminopeptidase